MIFSMTGFGRGVRETNGRKITVEIKSLNSKQMDLFVRIPSYFREEENDLRNYLNGRLKRGKVEAAVSVDNIDAAPPVKFNIEALRRYKTEIESLDESLEIDHPADWHQVLLRLPDAMKSEESEVSDDDKEALREALGDAVDAIEEFRKTEGRKLYDFFISKVENIASLLKAVEPFEAERIPKIRARLQEQLEKLTGVEYDSGRLEQELIFYIEKLDISEEKQRLAAHLDYFLKTLGSADDSAGEEMTKGKKLGFILQEMGREINTMGSKSNNADMQIVVVKMKDELEQMKEQVLNVL